MNTEEIKSTESKVGSIAQHKFANELVAEKSLLHADNLRPLVEPLLRELNLNESVALQIDCWFHESTNVTVGWRTYTRKLGHSDRFPTPAEAITALPTKANLMRLELVALEAEATHAMQKAQNLREQLAKLESEVAA